MIFLKVFPKTLKQYNIHFYHKYWSVIKIMHVLHIIWGIQCNHKMYQKQCNWSTFLSKHLHENILHSHYQSGLKKGWAKVANQLIRKGIKDTSILHASQLKKGGDICKLETKKQHNIILFDWFIVIKIILSMIHSILYMNKQHILLDVTKHRFCHYCNELWCQMGWAGLEIQLSIPGGPS